MVNGLQSALVRSETLLWGGLALWQRDRCDHPMGSLLIPIFLTAYMKEKAISIALKIECYGNGGPKVHHTRRNSSMVAK